MMPGEFASQLDAENNQSPSMNPIPIPETGDTGEAIDFLINRVSNVVAESAQMGTEPLTTIAAVLANLYQAKALQELAITAVEIRDVLEEIHQDLFGLGLYLREARDDARESIQRIGIGSEMFRSDEPK